MKKIVFLLIIALAAATIMPSCSTTSRSRGFNYAGHSKKQKKAKGGSCKYMKYHNADRKNMKGVF